MIEIKTAPEIYNFGRARLSQWHLQSEFQLLLLRSKCGHLDVGLFSAVKNQMSHEKNPLLSIILVGYWGSL